MRLLETASFQLQEFLKGNVPRYSILSHTWGKEEVSYQEVCSAENVDFKKSGFGKVWGCVEQSLQMSLEYTWIDSCCINSDSSAELSEAINSMYAWYQNAEVCFAYLSDVHTTQSDPAFEESFKRSRWFTRGWCLQELIAPQQLFFFNSSWAKIGTKSTLHPLISETTGIDTGSLLDPKLSSISIARRMSWASKRQTTRVEDIAYCLLGIFDVNMPLLYGEGDKAFSRLQEEIMKEMDDHSIFAWSSDEKLSDASKIGVLAKHPSYFRLAASIEPHPTQWGPYSLTNKGIQINLPLLETDKPGEHLAVLGCHEENDFRSSVGLLLHEVGTEERQYVRYHRNTIPLTVEQTAEAKLQTIFLSKRDKVDEIERLIDKCWIRTHPNTSIRNQNVRVAAVVPKTSWNFTYNIMNIRGWLVEEMVVAYVKEINKDTAEARTKKNEELAFAVVLQLSPVDELAAVSLHLLEDHTKAKDEATLKRLILKSQSAPSSPTSKMKAGDQSISAAIRVEMIRGQRVFVLDVEMEDKDDVADGSDLGYFASYPDRRLTVLERHRSVLAGSGEASRTGGSLRSTSRIGRTDDVDVTLSRLNSIRLSRGSTDTDEDHGLQSFGL
jgi:hypothetical protein